jgi:hypothetical protein
VNNFTIAPGRQAIDTSCATDYISKHSGYQVGLHAYKFSVAGILFERKTYHRQISIVQQLANSPSYKNIYENPETTKHAVLEKDTPTPILRRCFNF